MDGKIKTKETGDVWLQKITELSGNDFHVTEIALNGSTVTSVGMEHFRDLHSLRSLNLDGSKYVQDAGLESLRTLTSLEYLDLSGTAITTKAFEIFRQVPTLKTLVLRKTPKINQADLADSILSLKQINPHVNVVT